MRTALLAGASAAALAAAPVTVSALTAEEAWASWQALAEDNDVSLTAGSETDTGAGLLVSTVAFATESEDGSTVTGTIGEISFVETGDGMVEVTMSDTIPLMVSTTSEDGAPVAIAITLSQPGLVYRVGDAEGGGVTATYSVPTFTAEIDSVEEAGAAQDVSGTIAAAEVSGAYTVTEAEPRTIASKVEAGMLEIAISGTDPDSGGQFDFAFSMADVLSDTTSTGGSIYTMSDNLAEMIAAGFTAEGSGSSGPVSFRIIAEGMPETVDIAGSMDGGTGAMSIDGDRLAYDVTYTGIAFSASGSEIPVPQVSGALGEWHTLVSLPAGPADAAGPVAFTLALRDLALGEAVWSMFDPAGALPRAPATLVIDLAGQMRFLTDLFAGAPNLGGGPPAEVEALDIRELRLALAGAELTGSGAFTFDNSGSGPFGPGMPAPDGTVNLSLTGGQTLLDRLVTMGLLGQEQAMMARMMTGILAKPGAGPDELVSEITVRPDGSVLANGAPLPF